MHKEEALYLRFFTQDVKIRKFLISCFGFRLRDALASLGFLISGERVDSSEEAEDLVFLLLKN